MSGRRFRKLIPYFCSRKRTLFSFGFLLAAAFFCLFAPLLFGDPDRLDVVNTFAAPCFRYPLGTDELGRNFLLRVLYGGRVTIGVGVMAMLVSTVIGVALGMISGYCGGLIDTLLMSLVEVISSIPWMLLVIVVQLFLKRGIFSLILVIGLLGWCETARMVRSLTLSVRTLEYVEYARLCGISTGMILVKHVLPAGTPIILAAGGASAAKAIMLESTLSFLNLGVQPPDASWGSLLQGAQKYLMKAPLQAIVPGLLIVATVYSITQIGNNLSVVIDPKYSEEIYVRQRNIAH